MTILSYYLIASFISIYLFRPKTKVGLWLGVFTLPLMISIWYFLYSYTMASNSYEIGKMFSACILPMLVSLAVNFFYLNKKLKNEGKIKFPFILITVIIATFLFGYLMNSENNTIKDVETQITKSPESETALNWIKYRVGKTKENLPLTSSQGFYMNEIDYDERKNIITYTYKDINVNLAALKLSDEDIEKSKQDWKDMFLRINKNDKNKEAYIEANTSFIYKIIDKNDEPILNFLITPDEYK